MKCPNCDAEDLSSEPCCVPSGDERIWEVVKPKPNRLHIMGIVMLILVGVPSFFVGAFYWLLVAAWFAMGQSSWGDLTSVERYGFEGIAIFLFFLAWVLLTGRKRAKP